MFCNKLFFDNSTKITLFNSLHCKKNLITFLCHFDRMMRFFYDSHSGKCKRFYYGGCQSNGNNFLDERDCIETCVTDDRLARALQPQDLDVHSPCKQVWRYFIILYEVNLCTSSMRQECEYQKCIAFLRRCLIIFFFAKLWQVLILLKAVVFISVNDCSETIFSEGSGYRALSFSHASLLLRRWKENL